MTKVGRNDPCPCGSGKKWKKCHGGPATTDLKMVPEEPAWPPKRLAADLWAVFNFGNPNDRYQKFLKRGRPPIKQLIESFLLHPEVLVPTEDYLSLSVLVGTLGERAVIEMLDSGRLKFVRLRGSLAYIGNGGGIQFYEIGDPDKPSPHCAPVNEAIAWALGGLNVPVKDPALAKLAVRATREVAGTDISDAIRHETYMDVLNSPYLRNRFAIRNTNMERLAGIGPKGVRIYGGPDEPSSGDEIDTVLALGMVNVELRLADVVGASDVATASPVGQMLKAKVERTAGREIADSFGELREIADIPDVGEAVLGQHVTVAEVLTLAASRDGAAFQDWFHKNCRTDALTTAREYARVLKEVPRVQAVPTKILRFLLTTAAGLIPGLGLVMGPAASGIDSFVLDRIARGSSPKYFIERLDQLASR